MVPVEPRPCGAVMHVVRPRQGHQNVHVEERDPIINRAGARTVGGCEHGPSILVHSARDVLRSERWSVGADVEGR
jgi:hypothetical protein